MKLTNETSIYIESLGMNKLPINMFFRRIFIDLKKNFSNVKQGIVNYRKYEKGEIRMELPIFEALIGCCILLSDG